MVLDGRQQKQRVVTAWAKRVQGTAKREHVLSAHLVRGRPRMAESTQCSRSVESPTIPSRLAAPWAIRIDNYSVLKLVPLKNTSTEYLRAATLLTLSEV